MTDTASATNRSSRFFASTRSLKQQAPEPQSRESAIHSWVMGVHAEADSILANNGTMKSLPPTPVTSIVVVPSAVPPPVPPKDEPPTFTIVDANNNSIPTNPRAKKGRPGSILSISSGDSVNLEDLINHNTSINLDSDSELPDLGDLEVDDSKDDFWKMEADLEKFFPITNATAKVASDSTPSTIRPAATSSTPPMPKAASSRTSRKSKYNKARVGGGGDSDNSLEDFDNVDVDSLWDDKMDTMEKTPEEDDFDMSLVISRDGKALSSPSHSSIPGAHRNTSMYSRLPHSPSNLHRRPRSGSQSSENSSTSQSTVLGNSHLPRPFSPSFPAESTSASSGGRSLSRLSNYSNGSQTSSTGLQRPRTISTNSSASNNGSSLQTPSSGRLRSPHASQTPTKRGSHIPSPNPAAHIISPIPSPTTSNASSTAEYPQRSLSRVSNSSYSSQGTSPVSRRISALPRPGTPTGSAGNRISAPGMAATPRVSMYGSTPNRPRTSSNTSSTGTPAYASPSSRGSITQSSPPARASSIATSTPANRTSRVPPPRTMSPAPGMQRANATTSESTSRVTSPLANRSGTPTNGLRMSKIGIPALGRKTGT